MIKPKRTVKTFEIPLAKLAGVRGGGRYGTGPDFNDIENYDFDSTTTTTTTTKSPA